MLQALSNNYTCLQAHVNNALTWQSSCVIANNARKTANAICSRLSQNVTGTYVIIVLVYRLRWQSSCLITNNAPKTAKAICPKL